jgi:fructoselysine-6-P-deglycase FrlB-like protein
LFVPARRVRSDRAAFSVRLASAAPIRSRILTNGAPHAQPGARAQAVLSFYRLVEAAARARGLDPDRPSRLAKVTRTL